MLGTLLAIARLENPVGAEFGWKVERSAEAGQQKEGEDQWQSEQPRGGEFERDQPAAHDDCEDRECRKCDPNAAVGREKQTMGRAARDRCAHEMKRRAL